MPIELAEEPGAALTPVADAVTKALAEISTTNATMTELVTKARELHVQFKDVVWDLTTVKGAEEARRARQALREDCRYPLQKAKEAGSKMLGTMQRQFNARADELIAEVQAFEEPIHRQITADEERRERERIERQQAEDARIQRHLDEIDAFGKAVTGAVGMSSAELQAVIDGLTKAIIDEGYEEFRGRAEQARDEALRQLNGMLVSAKLDEAERAEIAETRRQQAQVAAAQVARVAELERREREVAEREDAARRQAEEVQRAAAERATAIEARILSMLGNLNAGLQAVHSADVKHFIDELPDPATITADLYGDRVDEARGVRVEVGSRLVTRYGELKKDEADEAERQRIIAEEDARRERAADVQGRIDAIATAGAPLDGRPSEELASAIRTLQSCELTAEFLDDRVAEAAQARVVRLMELETAHANALEREERERQEAEQRRLNEEREAAQRATAAAIMARSARMYVVLERLVQHKSLLEATDGFDWWITDEAAAIVNEVEGHKA